MSWIRAWFPIKPGYTLFIGVCALVYYDELLDLCSSYTRLRMEVTDVVGYQFESVVAFVETGNDMNL